MPSDSMTRATGEMTDAEGKRALVLAARYYPDAVWALARLSALESEVERLTRENKIGRDFDAEWVNSLPRDAHGFTRTQEEWDTLALYARRLRALGEYRSKKIARLRGASSGGTA